jgi:hypothetical protein
MYVAETVKPKHLVIEKKPGIAQTYMSIGARTASSRHPRYACDRFDMCIT